MKIYTLDGNKFKRTRCIRCWNCKNYLKEKIQTYYEGFKNLPGERFYFEQQVCENDKKCKLPNFKMWEKKK